jgi:hypothetical protein
MATIGTKRQIRRIWCCWSTFKKLFSTSFSCFNSKKTCLGDFSYAVLVTLQMTSNSRRSSLVINAHLPIYQAGGRYCSDGREFEMTVIWQQLTSRWNLSYKE